MRIETYKETDDDWYPCYKIGKKEVVRVALLSLYDSVKKFRVCVWGDDDFGMEQDFINEEIARECFLTVIGWEKVNQDTLLSYGFTNA